MTLARTFRPQLFSEIVGQQAIVQALQNAIALQQFASAYLFCGMRGTGKTTLARIMAKAINCPQRNAQGEPCNACLSCKEITRSCSLQCIEIDAASHRGIEEIRAIHDNLSYAPTEGQYKIYIIDEIHMLTIAAFNALLKTLEEPPPQTVFFFATTDVQKIPATILSRCQRFTLSPHSMSSISSQLQFVAKESSIAIEQEAVQWLAKRAQGSLRDALSQLEQVAVFSENKVTMEQLHAVLGSIPIDLFFALDQSMANQDFKAAFSMTETLFAEGKEPLHFLDSLIEHVHHLTRLCLSLPLPDTLSEREKERYIDSAKQYTTAQCHYLLDFLMKQRPLLIQATSQRIWLESILLHFIRSKQRIEVESVLQQLLALEKTTPPIALKQEKAKAVIPEIVETVKSPPSCSQTGEYETLLQFSTVLFQGKMKKKQ